MGVKDVVIDKPFPQSEITNKEAKIVLVITTNGKKIDIEYATEKDEALLETVNINAIVEKIEEDINFPPEERLLVAINGREIVTEEREFLQSLLEKQTGIKTSVVVNKSPEEIKNIQRETTVKYTVFEIYLKENENSKVTVIVDDSADRRDDINNIKEVIGTVLDTTFDMEFKRKELIISIATKKELQKAKSFGENLKSVLEDVIGLKTSVLVNSKFTKKDKNIDFILINIQFDDIVTLDEKIEGSGKIPEERDKLVQVLQQEIQEENSRKENTAKHMILVINGRPINATTNANLQEIISRVTGISSVEVLNNNYESNLENLNDFKSIVINIELPNNEHSTGSFYVKGVSTKDVIEKTPAPNADIISKVK